MPDINIQALLDRIEALEAELAAEREAHAKTRAEMATAIDQRDTAYGYGNDGGMPPWMK